MSTSDGKLRPWRQIAQELAEERDAAKVTTLAKELTEALDAQGPRSHFNSDEQKAKEAALRKRENSGQ